MIKIKTLKNNNRMSTQELLQMIYKKIEEGHTDFEIEACGQHDIGGALWSKVEKPLYFRPIQGSSIPNGTKTATLPARFSKLFRRSL